MSATKYAKLCSSFAAIPPYSYQFLLLLQLNHVTIIYPVILASNGNIKLNPLSSFIITHTSSMVSTLTSYLSHLFRKVWVPSMSLGPELGAKNPNQTDKQTKHSKASIIQSQGHCLIKALIIFLLIPMCYLMSLFPISFMSVYPPAVQIMAIYMYIVCICIYMYICKLYM